MPNHITIQYVTVGFSAAYINTPLSYERGKTKLSFTLGEITRIQFIDMICVERLQLKVLKNFVILFFCSILNLSLLV